jgi:hypothetical protein
MEDGEVVDIMHTGQCQENILTPRTNRGFEVWNWRSNKLYEESHLRFGNFEEHTYNFDEISVDI